MSIRKELERINTKEKMSPENQAIYWMNKGREAMLDQGDRHEFIERIERLEKKLNDVIEKINFISQYYESKGDYAGTMTDLDYDKAVEEGK